MMNTMLRKGVGCCLCGWQKAEREREHVSFVVRNVEYGRRRSPKRRIQYWLYNEIKPLLCFAGHNADAHTESNNAILSVLKHTSSTSLRAHFFPTTLKLITLRYREKIQNPALKVRSASFLACANNCLTTSRDVSSSMLIWIPL